MKFKTVAVMALAAFLLAATSFSSPVVRADGPVALYVPDMTEAHLASELGTATANGEALADVVPFWADLVDQELVTNDGEGVYVAVLDTGLMTPWPFFFSQANVANHLGKGFTHDVTWNPAIGDVEFGPLRDDRGFITEWASGHGTHVASTVVGYHYAGSAGDFWVTGIAPKATLIPVLVLDAWIVDTGDGLIGLSGGTDEMVSAGIYYVADLELDGPVVINMSLGGPSPSPMIEEAINYAIGKGVIVVISAGNEGTDGMGYPGAYPQVISCAAAGWAEMFTHRWSGDSWLADVPEALNQNDSLGNNGQLYLEDFSSRPVKALGQKHKDLDVAAPGAWVVGPYKPTYSSDADIGYYWVSGTSMAAPHVSAMAALVLQSHPDMEQAEMEFILKNAARGVPLPADDAIVAYYFEDTYYSTTWDGGDYGAGFLQADAAVAKAAVLAK
jgi:subtilisin family serine protease